MTAAWLRGLLGGDAKVIALVSPRSTHGRIHLLNVADDEPAELGGEDRKAQRLNGATPASGWRTKSMPKTNRSPS